MMWGMGKKRGVKSEQKKETRLEGVASLCGTLVMGLFVLTFVFENFVIPSSSMASTLQVGDHVMVEREMLAPPTRWTPLLPYRDVRRGDVVVFYKPIPEADGDHIPLVKRVVGVPGDHIHLRNGIVYLNGVAQNEPHAAKPTADIYDPYVDDFPSVPPAGRPGVTAAWSVLLPESMQGDDLVVPAGCYFMMGDNRDHSLDSRFWGFVPRENILGRPLFVYWSFDGPENDELKPSLSEQAGTMVHEMMHFFDKTRWGRTLHRIE
jgi:signal peptidase I